VPCGIPDKGVTSIARLLGDAPPMARVVDVVTARFAEHLGFSAIDVQRASDSRHAEHPIRMSNVPRSESEAAVSISPRREPKPEWMRVKVDLGEGYRETKRLMRSLSLHTVCEEAACPNIYECWADRTATFMILGDRCTRACGFCLVDTRKPLPLDIDEPARVADAVVTLGLEHAVITSVARDDAPDGGAAIFAATIRATRARSPRTKIEVLIPDCKGDPDALGTIFDAEPDVLNHNMETVARLQRAVRPNASYARSLAVLARARAVGLTTKSGLVLGMGEREEEVVATMADLRAVGTEIVTIGQYLRPTARHLPVARWWTPDEFARLKATGEAMGIGHIESSALTRSSYHAAEAANVAISGRLAGSRRGQHTPWRTSSPQ
jgi:lipoic acid synthetase